MTVNVVKTSEDTKSLNPDITFDPIQAVPDALIHKLATPTLSVSGDAPVVRVPYAKKPHDVGFVKEGEEIDTSVPNLSEIHIHTGKIADVVVASYESTLNERVPMLLDRSMRNSIRVKADTAFFSNTGEPTGLAQVESIPSTYTIDGTNLDAIQDALVDVRAHGASPQFLACDPKFWGRLSKMKEQKNSIVPLLGSPSETDGLKLFGLEVVVSEHAPKNTAFIIDPAAILSALGDVRANKSDHACFIRDAVAYRVAWRLGWNVLYPEQLAKVTTTEG